MTYRRQHKRWPIVIVVSVLVVFGLWALLFLEHAPLIFVIVMAGLFLGGMGIMELIGRREN